MLMRARRILCVGFLVLSGPQWVLAQSSPYVNDFLQMGLGTRALGMGGAPFVSIADDPSAIYWNPAGLTQIPRKEVEATYRQRYGGLFKDQEISSVFPMNKSAFGFSYFQTTVGDVPVVRELSQSEENSFVSNAGDLPAASFSNTRDSALFMSWADVPIENLSIGVTGKIINRNFLDTLHAWGYGLDSGALYRKGPWGLGLSFQDLLQGLKWKGNDPNTNEDLSYNESAQIGVRMGVSYTMQVIEGGTTLTGSLSGERVGSGFWPRLGTEFNYRFIRFRGGLSINASDPQSDSGFKSSYTYQPSFGLGATVKSFELEYGLRFHPLGMIQSFSLNYKWGLNPNDINLTLPRHKLVLNKKTPSEDTSEMQSLMSLLNSDSSDSYAKRQ